MGQVSNSSSDDFEPLGGVFPRNQSGNRYDVARKRLLEQYAAKNVFWGSDYGDLFSYEFSDLGGISNLENYGFLPANVIHQFGLFLTTEDLLKCMLSCKLLHRVLNTELFWKELTISHHFSNCEEAEVPKEVENWKKKYISMICVSDAYFKKFYDMPKKLKPDSGEIPFKLVSLLTVWCTLNYFQKNRLMQGEFKPLERTIGATFQTLCLHRLQKGELQLGFKLEIWDTAGQVRFRSLSPMYYRGAAAAVVCFSITEEESFERAKVWIREVNEGNSGKTIVVLCGTHCDKRDERKVKHGTVRKYIEENGKFNNIIGYVESSAKEGTNVLCPIEKLVATMESEGISKTPKTTPDEILQEAPKL